MSPFPLPTVPNFRVSSGEPGLVRLNWADYPVSVKEGHKLLGFRIYRSVNEDELGERIADESVLGPAVFQFDDTDPQAGPNRHYVCVAVEESGFGRAPFGQNPFGEKNSNGFGLFPFGFRPKGSPLRGYGEAPYGKVAYGF
jgi:hypothetical protein